MFSTTTWLKIRALVSAAHMSGAPSARSQEKSAKNEREFALALVCFYVRSRSRSWPVKLIALALVSCERALGAPLIWAALTKALLLNMIIDYVTRIIFCWNNTLRRDMKESKRSRIQISSLPRYFFWTLMAGFHKKPKEKKKTWVKENFWST